MRLFIAIWPPEDVSAELSLIRRKDQRGVRFSPEENWHITLRFLGAADPDAVIEALDHVLLPRCEVRLGPAVDLVLPGIMGLPAHGIDELAAVVRGATADLGEPPRPRFVGHLTLARLKTHAIYSAPGIPSALGALFDARFTAESVALVHSKVDHRGARYTTLMQWPTVAASFED